MNSLHDLFLDMLQDVYYAERAIVKALPKLAKKAESEELKHLLLAHLDETKGQVARLEEVFSLVDQKPKAKKCHAIEGLMDEANAAIEEAQDGDVRNAAMVADAQAVEHYEMARYGALIAWAKELKLTKAVTLLQQTLEQEKSADQKLSKLAPSVNSTANKKIGS